MIFPLNFETIFAGVKKNIFQNQKTAKMLEMPRYILDFQWRIHLDFVQNTVKCGNSLQLKLSICDDFDRFEIDVDENCVSFQQPTN